MTRRLAGFTLTIAPTTLEEPDACRATVTTQNGRRVFRGYDGRIKIHSASGKDMDGDGNPDAIFEGFSGGAHCCWTYWIISLGPSPGLIRKICSWVGGTAFEDRDHDGKLEIMLFDGAFDYFDGLSHSVSPFPRVYLRLAGKHIFRINQHFRPAYQRQISELGKALTAERIALFRRTNGPGPEWKTYDWEETKSLILGIVLAYLYSGREDQAWQALGEMWPSQDQRRIRNEILKTARGSFLADPNTPHFGCLE